MLLAVVFVGTLALAADVEVKQKLHKPPKKHNKTKREHQNQQRVYHIRRQRIRQCRDRRRCCGEPTNAVHTPKNILLAGILRNIYSRLRTSTKECGLCKVDDAVYRDHHK